MRAHTRIPSQFALCDRKADKAMDVTLHLGAHRTASTVFQHYLRENTDELAQTGVEAWEPSRTRDGLLSGVVPITSAPKSTPDQLSAAKSRIALHLRRAKSSGVSHLVVSDENMIGAPRRNVRDLSLYRSIGDRLERYSEAFDQQITRVAISIRAQDSYWSSILAYSVGRGHRLPQQRDLQEIVTSQRGWQDVITDLSHAVPFAQILVLPYEIHGGFPERKLSLMTGLANPPLRHAREWLNRAPSLPELRKSLQDRGLDPSRLPDGEGRWQPFDHKQTAALREAYADDLYWLRAGADGAATLIEETQPEKMGQIPHLVSMTRGQPNGIEERRLARYR